MRELKVADLINLVNELRNHLTDSQKLYIACTVLGINYEYDGSELNQIVLYTGLTETPSGVVKKI